KTGELEDFIQKAKDESDKLIREPQWIIPRGNKKSEDLSYINRELCLRHQTNYKLQTLAKIYNNYDYDSDKHELRNLYDYVFECLFSFQRDTINTMQLPPNVTSIDRKDLIISVTNTI